MPFPVHETIFRSQPEEYAFVVTNIEGEIPTELSGTLLRSGPGLMQVGDDGLNFFDGHALIAGVSFADGRALFRSRFVRSPLYERETQAGALLQRRVFTNHPSRWSNLFALAFGNSAMHDVYAWGDGTNRRVVAGNDPGHFALDSNELATIGAERWSGAAAKGYDMAPMPYRDPHTGHLVGWLKKAGGLAPDHIKFVELDGDWRVARQTPLHRLVAAPTLLHDQRATERWYVATEQALRLSVGSAVWGAKSVFDSFSRPKGTTATIILVPREGVGALIRVPLPEPLQIAFHVINAFDDGDRVVVDLVTYGGRTRLDALAARTHRERMGISTEHGPMPVPMRFVIDPAKAEIVAQRPIGDVTGEAPEVADEHMGKPYRFAYLPIGGPADDTPDRSAYVYFSRLAKVDVENNTSTHWSVGADAIVSPSAFVARPNTAAEDDGWLLAYVIREHHTGVVILDARDLTSGPLATLDLGVRLPGVSHVRFAPDVRLRV